MHVLVLAEHDGDRLRAGTTAALGFSRQLANGDGDQVTCLVLGDSVATVADDAATFGPVLLGSHADLAEPLADRWAEVTAKVVRSESIDILLGASSTFSRSPFQWSQKCLTIRNRQNNFLKNLQTGGVSLDPIKAGNPRS